MSSLVAMVQVLIGAAAPRRSEGGFISLEWVIGAAAVVATAAIVWAKYGTVVASYLSKL